MIKIGHSLDILKGMDAESVSACVTSPPYWGLRTYQTEPQIWDGDEKCDHEWGDEPILTCIHCGAWRGELGSEKSPEMFIFHLCDIFDEVKRVLRKDGVCWVNMGSSYASSVIEVDMELRDDLTPDEKVYVLEELAKCKIL